MCLAEAPVIHTEFMGQTLRECGFRERFGLNVAGLWEGNSYMSARPDSRIDEASILLLAGTADQLEAYDRKAEREMRVLDQYAEAAGMNRQQYLEQLEGARNEQLLSAEIEKCRAEFPETPDAALKAIAEGRMASQRAAAAQAAEQQRAELTAMQQRIDQTVEQAREEADARAWEEYVSLSGVKSFEEVPKRVLELVQQEAMTPVAAHWRYQAEQNAQAVQIEKKNNQNKMTSPGSVQGNEGDTSDPFLRGLLGL